MKLPTALLALALLGSTTTVALAQVKVHDHRTDKKKMPPPPPPAWDAKGWTKLGELVVNGKSDHDSLGLGTSEGKFTKLTVVVEDSDLEMFDISIKFGNGDEYSPQTRLVFKEGSRTGAIDLPGDARVIDKIDFHYGNLAGGGKATVAVYGLAAVEAPPPATTWDPTGWTKLGEETVDGKKDRDFLHVGAYQGAFDQLTFAVADADIELQSITITFDNGKKFKPKVSHFVFEEGTRTRAIDLPGNSRIIKKIEMRYRNVSRDQATVIVYGRASATGTGTVVVHDHRSDAKGAGFDAEGWEFLGEKSVDGKLDVDTVKVPKGHAAVEKVMLVVLDGSLEMKSVVFQFRGVKAKDLAVDVKHTFAEGDRTRAIDIQGGRKLKDVQLVYGALTGTARVQVWIK